MEVSLLLRSFLYIIFYSIFYSIIDSLILLDLGNRETITIAFEMIILNRFNPGIDGEKLMKLVKIVQSRKK